MGDRPADRSGRRGEAESLTAAGSEAGDLKRPDPLGPLLDPLNPARLHRRFDERRGLDADDQSDKPEAPEIPEPVFLEFTRPLGTLKYENELNYLIVAPTGRVPASQFLEYEYVFADWRAAKFEMEFSQGKLETLEPGYQRTLGVGRRHNWVHGFQVFPELFIQEKFDRRVGLQHVALGGCEPDDDPGPRRGAPQAVSADDRPGRRADRARRRRRGGGPARGGLASTGRRRRLVYALARRGRRPGE